jgi:DNA-binding MurR/RpiR family transcriptional regulator
MIGHGEKLTRKQEQAIAALLSEQTLATAAERTGVSEATLRRWLKLDGFVAEYRTARREVVEKATAQLQQASWAASSTLIKLLGSTNDSVRLRAAVAILEQAKKGVELIDFDERLTALEHDGRSTEPRAFNGRRTA